jgi:ribosome-associated protein
MMDPQNNETMALNRLPTQVLQAVQAAQDKKAADVVVLDLHEVAGFTDYFVICSGQSPRQVKAIADGVEDALRKAASGKPSHVEGYDRAEWILLDYFDFIVHIFNPKTRLFYALERLWGSAGRISMPDPAPKVEGRARS